MTASLSDIMIHTGRSSAGPGREKIRFRIPPIHWQLECKECNFFKLLNHHGRVWSSFLTPPDYNSEDFSLLGLSSSRFIRRYY